MEVVLSFLFGLLIGLVVGLLAFRKNQQKFNDLEAQLKEAQEKIKETLK